MAKIPCDRTEYGLTFLAPKVLTTHDIIAVVVVGEKVFFSPNSAKIHITSSITVFLESFLVSQDLFPKDLIEVGHVKRRGSSAASRQMSLYRSTLELQSWEKFRL